MVWLDRVSLYANRALSWIGGFFLVGMILLTCANIVSRLFWSPVRGTFELMGYFGAVATAFALGYTQIKKGHISVSILIDKFPERLRSILMGVNSLICLLFFGVVAWQLSKKAMIYLTSGEVTETLRIIYYPFTFATALGFVALALVFLTEFLKALFPGKGGLK